MAQPVVNCHFTKIPAELRLAIYEEVFALPVSEDEVDITKAVPPSNALLLTCKEVSKEARGIYQRENQRFWSESHFCTPHLLSPYPSSDAMVENVLRAINAIKDEDVAKIKHCRAVALERPGFSWPLRHGVWRWASTSRVAHLIVPRAAMDLGALETGLPQLLDGPEVLDVRVYNKVDDCALLDLNVRGKSAAEIEAAGLALGRVNGLTKAELKIVLLLCTAKL